MVTAFSPTCLMFVSVRVTAGEGSVGSEEGRRQASPSLRCLWSEGGWEEG